MSELINPITRKAVDKHYSNLAWYQNNYLHLKKGHNEQFILIIDEGKTEYHNDIIAVRKRLKKDDINKQSVVIEYISDNDSPLMV
jgi:hypothetical protein